MTNKDQYQNEQQDTPHCIIDKASIFVGLTSLPVGHECEFRDRLRGMFENHLKKISQNFRHKSEEFGNIFFRPQFYYTFSAFDLTILSLINDFEFPTQAFHPYHPLFWPDTPDKIASFQHQVNVGLVPRFSSGEDSVAVKLAQTTFLNNQPLPLIAVCQLKLNNECLIGTGTDFLRCVIKALRRRYEEEAKKQDGKWKKDNLQIIILRSVTWSELTLILFSTSYNLIAQFLLEIRSLRIKNLKEILVRRDIKDWDCLIRLLSKRIRHAAGEEEPVLKKFSNAPLFVNSTTILGFRFELFEWDESAQNIEPIDEHDKVYPFCRFLAEPAHLGTAIKNIIGEKPLNECLDSILLCAGRGDFVYPLWGKHSQINSGYSEIPIPTKELVKMVANTFRKEGSETYLTGVNIIISKEPGAVFQNTKDSDKLFQETKEKVAFFKDHLIDLVVPVDEIRTQIYGPMRRSALPKVVTLRIINCIGLYNEGVQDEFLFSSFLELRSYVEKLLAIVRSTAEGTESCSDISELLNRNIDIFEKAWRNRFHATWRLGEITDFNLEFKGGIQQMVSAIDGAYKAVSSVLGIPGSVVVVAGSPRISSTEMSIELNYYDIFQPEFFAARASHESACHKYKEISAPNIFKDIKSKDMNDLIAVEILRLKQKLPMYDEWFDPDITPLSPELFRKIFADMCSLRFTFLNDIDLFIFWYRNIFITDPVAWKIKEGKSSTKNESLMDFLTRLCFILTSHEGAVELIARHWSKDIIPDLGLDFMNIQKFHKVIKNIISNSKLFRRLLDISLGKISELASEVNFDISKAKNHATKMQSDLESGRVCRYDHDIRKHRESSFLFVQSLFYAFLSLIKKKAGKGKILLTRDKENGEPIFNSNDAEILFDKRGGTFVFDEDTMSWFFKVRCAFIMSLWDMSTKEKYYVLKLQRILEE
jgi:hypothetical protein